MISIEDVRNAIVSADCDIDVNKITPSQSLQEAGIDSLDFFNIILEVQSIAGRDIPDEDIDALQTMEDFVKYFSE